jgi:hypothetical protein
LERIASFLWKNFDFYGSGAMALDGNWIEFV